MTIIKNLRDQFGYTQAELAEQSSLSLRTIQRLESSNKAPKGHTLTALADVFKITPKTLQDRFKAIATDETADSTSVRLINLSVLSFLGIPFGNIIFPFLLWRKNRKSKLVDTIGRRIINFQIMFSATLSILLCLTPFISKQLFSNTPVILYILCIAYLFNIVIVCKTALKLQRNDFNVLNSPLRFI